MEHVYTILFNAAALAGALGISQSDVSAIMTDARTATPIIQRRVAADHPGWTLAKAKGGSDELRDPAGHVWRVKSITDVTNFPPSKQIGSGRTVDIKEFVANWQGLAGYILVDIDKFPSVGVHVVPIANIQRWYKAGKLGTDAKVRRPAMMQLLGDVIFKP